MEPIKINIEVGLKQTTLEALARIFGPTMVVTQPDAEPEKPQPDPEPKRKAKKAEPAPKTPEPTPAPEPAPAPASEPVKTALGPDEDLPADDAPAPEKAKNPPTEAEMRSAIQATRKRGVAAKTIKDYIRETFGVETSVECPEARRQELIDGLASLAA